MRAGTAAGVPLRREANRKGVVSFFVESGIDIIWLGRSGVWGRVTFHDTWVGGGKAIWRLFEILRGAKEGQYRFRFVR